MKTKDSEAQFISVERKEAPILVLLRDVQVTNPHKLLLATLSLESNHFASELPKLWPLPVLAT